MGKLLLTFITYILLTGFSYGTEIITYGFDNKQNFSLPNISSDQVLPILRSAMNEWERICDVRFIYDPYPSFMFRSREIDKKTFAYCYGRNGGITFNTVLPEGITWNADNLLYIGIHELGHLLGLRHNYRDDSIMRVPVIATRPGFIDAINVQRIWGKPKK